MTKRPPATITVGPYVYDVTTSQRDFDIATRTAVCRGDEPAFYGTTNHHALRIIIDPSQAPRAMRDTTLHETLHAITDLVGLRAELTTDEEEQFVTRVSPALLDVLQRNPDLVAFLVDG